MRSWNLSVKFSSLFSVVFCFEWSNLAHPFLSMVLPIQLFKFLCRAYFFRSGMPPSSSKLFWAFFEFYHFDCAAFGFYWLVLKENDNEQSSPWFDWIKNWAWYSRFEKIYNREKKKSFNSEMKISKFIFCDFSENKMIKKRNY